MIRLFILIGGAILLFAAIRWLIRQPPRIRWQFIAVVVAIGLLLMVVTGRAHWLAAVFAAMLPFLRAILTVLNHFPMIKRLLDLLGVKLPGAQQKGGQTSTVQSRYLRMTLDHETGEMKGDILQGQFMGRSLGDLNLDELKQLHDECQDDEESVSLLEAYISREHADEWERGAETGSDQPRDDHGNMSHDEALEILGLTDGATEEEIIRAHRRLIQNIHPDRGGSAYLAAKINKAKDVLLGN